MPKTKSILLFSIFVGGLLFLSRTVYASCFCQSNCTHYCDIGGSCANCDWQGSDCSEWRVSSGSGQLKTDGSGGCFCAVGGEGCGGGGGCSDPLPTCTGASDSPTIIYTTGNQNVVVTVTGVTKANKVKAYVWTEVGGQDDLYTYDLLKQSDGTTWKKTIDMAVHHANDLGEIYIHIYMENCKTDVNKLAPDNGWCASTNIVRVSADVPTGTLAAPSIVVSHFGNPNPVVDVVTTGKDSGTNLSLVELFKRKCTTNTCHSNFGSPVATFNGWKIPGTGTHNDHYNLTFNRLTDMGLWNLILRVTDTLNNRCSGNPDYTYPRSDGVYDCDSTPTSGGTDSIFVDAQAAPTAWITASASTIAPGTTVTFRAGATDPEGDLNKMEITRRKCTDPSCTAFVPFQKPDGTWRSDGWYSPPMMCSVSFSVTTSASWPGAFIPASNTCSWTPLATDVGTWQVAVNAYDKNSPVIACSGNPDPVYPNGNWYNCGNDDLVTINVADNSMIDGTIIDGGTCNDDCTGCDLTPWGALDGAQVVWETGDVVPLWSTNNISGGEFNIPSAMIDTPLLQLSLDLNEVVISDDLVLSPMCVLDESGVEKTGFVPVLGNKGFGAPDGYVVSGVEPFVLAYGFNSVLEHGWITSIGGDVYSGTAINQTVPSELTATFTNTLIQSLTYGTYAFSGGDISVASSSEDRIFNEGYGNGSASDIHSAAAPSGFDVGLDLEAPADATRITDFGSELAEGGVYEIDVSDFNEALSSDVSYFVENHGVAVVYITGDGVVNINKEFRPRTVDGKNNSRVMLLTTNKIIIGSGVGSDIPVENYSNVVAFIVTSHDDGIVVETSGNLATELSLTVKGSLIATKGKVDMKRDRGLQNKYPSLVVRYDPVYLYSLTNQEQQDLHNALYPDLLRVSIDWRK